MSSNIHAFTPTGKIKRPSYLTVATWVKESWDEVSDDLIQRSFKCCGISTNIDGSEDDCLFDYDNLLDPVDDIDDIDDEVVEDLSNLNDDEEYPEEDHYKNDWNVNNEKKERNEEKDEDEDEEKRKEDDEESSTDEEVMNDLRKKYKAS